MNAPRALQLITTDESNKLEFNEHLLADILLHDDIKDRYVSIISVAGAFREGKSFLLNFFLRYLQTKYVDKRDVREWLSLSEAPIGTGFSWASGSKLHTMGILMWSEVFFVDLPNGDKGVIILLDTQGSFDNQSTIKDCATIFALSILLSSMPIYNIMRNINQSHLQHLELFAAFGSIITHEDEPTRQRPFQRLMFLVRDWPYPDEKPYGRKGGEELLLQTVRCASKVEEIEKQNENILRLFEEISCFLLPAPGRDVETSPKFHGELSKIDGEFKEHMQELAPLILAPENLVLKTIGGEKVKAGQFVGVFKDYVDMFRDGEMPALQTFYETHSKLQYGNAASEALKTYERLFSTVTQSNLERTTLQHYHVSFNNSAINRFRFYKKMTNKEINNQYLATLKKQIKEHFGNIRIKNALKELSRRTVETEA